MKKAVALIIIAALCFLLTPCTFAEIAEEYQKELKAAFLAESSSMAAVLEWNPDEKLNVAGLSRLPSLLAVCRAFSEGKLSLEQSVTVSRAASEVSGPTAFVQANERISAESLLKSAVMISAGDALYALGEAAFGSEEAFLAAVNSELKALGIDAEYTSCVGENAQLSARDLFLTAKELVRNEYFCKFSSLYMDEISHENASSTELVNPNKLVKNYAGCFGAATGSSSDAGYCGVFTVEKNGMKLILVTVGSENSSKRFETATKLLDAAFAGYSSVRLIGEGEIVAEDIKVANSAGKKLSGAAARELSVLLSKDGTAPSKQIELTEGLSAPIKKGDKIGVVNFVGQDGKTAASVDIVAADDIAEATLFDYILFIARTWVELVWKTGQTAAQQHG